MIFNNLVLILVLMFFSGCLSRVKDLGENNCVEQEMVELPAVDSDENEITFIAFGDPQYSGGKKNIERSRQRLDQNIKAMNSLLLNTTVWKDTNELVQNIKGVIIAGDLSQYGNGNEYDEFSKRYGVCANKDLKYYVYEGYGNHDYYGGDLTKQEVASTVSQRNKYRPYILHKAPANDGHYSWNWGNIHFIQLNLVAADYIDVGNLKTQGPEDDPRTRNFDPNSALTFLKIDLENFTLPNQKIMVITHYGFHQGWDDYWWSKGQWEDYLRTIDGYNVIGHIHGHAHQTSTYSYSNLNIFDVGSPFFEEYNRDGRGHFTLFRINNEKLWAQDMNYDKENPTQLSVGWTREIIFQNLEKDF